MRAAGRALVIALLAAAAYAGSLRGEFLFDDGAAILDNGVVTGRLPWMAAFQRDFWGRSGRDSTNTYRPLVVLSFRADWDVGHGSPTAFHATNVAAHAAVSAAAYLALRALLAEESALGGAALFAVLAAPSEAVDSIVGRADVLLALFALLGLIAHARGRFALAAAALLLGAFCKESAVVAPVAWFLFRRERPGRAVAWYAAALAAAAAVRLFAFGSVEIPQVDLMRNPLRAVGPAARLFGAAHIFARFTLPGLIDPSRRLYTCTGPACGPSSASDLLAWAGLAALIALVAAPFLLWKRAPDAARGIAWFLIFFFPVSNLIVPASSVYGERLLYVPCIGLCAAIASGLFTLRPLGIAALAALAIWNAAALQARHRDWRSEIELYLSALPIAPDSAQVQANAAVAYYRLHDAAQAERHARISLQLWPNNPQAEVPLALALDHLGRSAESDPLLAHAYAASGLDVDIAADYARFLWRHGRASEALSVAQRAQAAHPQSAALEPLLRRLSSATPPRAR